MTDAECGDAQEKPQSRKGQADLTVQIQGHIAVIPDVPTHDHVVEYTYGEFDGCDQERTAETLQQKRSGRCGGMEQIQRHGCYAAGECHGPVGKATEENFQHTVDKTA